jgi:cation diffusion facilitator CzcD-associated flavoprotein CzcO
VPEQLDVAIVGAGPYGLSVAAHLPERRVLVFGEPMHTWRTRMPPDMLLRSDWEETSLSAPDDAGTIDVWAREAGEPRQNPIPLQTFLRYADWFRDRFVRENAPSNVAELDRAGGLYRLATAAGEEFAARKVVLAVGVTAFSYAPPPFRDALGDGVSFAIDPQDHGAQRGRRVIVVGGGQGGLESAALAARAGAEVELILRSRLHWFAEREPYTARGPVRQRLYRLAYPVVGYGPPPLNRLALHPELFAFVPKRLRRRLGRRILRAGGSPWLRAQVDGKVQITEERTVTTIARSQGGGLLLGLSDGTAREADAVILSTGFRFSLDRLSFLSPAVRAGIAVRDGWPVLDRSFRSSDPGLFFVGYAAEDRFGPISRFVPGTRFTAHRVREGLAP